MTLVLSFLFFFLKQKTAYEMRISDWSSGVCSSDLLMTAPAITIGPDATLGEAARLMHRHAVKRLPVVDPADGTILGIVSRTDLLKEIGRASCRERVCRYV